MLNAGGTDYPLVNEQYDRAGDAKKIHCRAFIEAYRAQEGPAVLRVSAQDRSLWSFFRGNETVLQKNVTIDITPPTLELIADDRYVNFGGVGADRLQAVRRHDQRRAQDRQLFFSRLQRPDQRSAGLLPRLLRPSLQRRRRPRATLVATDKAGNTREMSSSTSSKTSSTKRARSPISDEFLQNKVTPLLNDVGARQGSPKDIFIKVNKICARKTKTRSERSPRKRRPRCSGKAPSASSATPRSKPILPTREPISIQDEAIDNAYHLGYDLSVTKHYPAEAANSGVVAFVGDLGIYGNTVIIDHGLGLFTLYSHLSSIDVKVGDTVKQRQPLGKTGETGLAAGDHLHYGVYLHGVAILPVEWWDEKWIRDNVQPKLEGQTGESTERKRKKAKSTAKTGAQTAPVMSDAGLTARDNTASALKSLGSTAPLNQQARNKSKKPAVGNTAMAVTAAGRPY